MLGQADRCACRIRSPRSRRHESQGRRESSRPPRPDRCVNAPRAGPRSPASRSGTRDPNRVGDGIEAPRSLRRSRRTPVAPPHSIGSLEPCELSAGLSPSALIDPLLSSVGKAKASTPSITVPGAFAPSKTSPLPPSAVAPREGSSSGSVSIHRPSQPSPSSIRSARAHRSSDTKVRAVRVLEADPRKRGQPTGIGEIEQRGQRRMKTVRAEVLAHHQVGFGQSDGRAEVPVGAGQWGQCVDRVVAAPQFDEHQHVVAERGWLGRRHGGDDSWHGRCRRWRCAEVVRGGNNDVGLASSGASGREDATGEGKESASGNGDHASKFSGLTSAMASRAAGSVVDRMADIVDVVNESPRPRCCATRSKSSSLMAMARGSL